MMLLHIFKNLWNIRKRNTWIVIELIVITVVCWMVIDPLFVLCYNKSIPDGYDGDGLYKLELSMVPSDSVPPVEELYQLMNRLRSHPQVEAATYFLGHYPCARGYSCNNITRDTASVRVSFTHIIPHNDFFKTWRIRSAADGTWETLDKVEFQAGNTLLTVDAAMRLSPDKNLLNETVYERDSIPLKVVGLMQPVKMKNSMQPYYLRFRPWTEPIDKWIGDSYLKFFFRTKPNVSEQPFLEKFIPWMEENLATNGLFFSKVEPFHKIRERNDLEEGVTSEIRIKYALCYFFLINLFLGISGTFWLSTRTRREEMGIRLSYGASPWKIQWMLLAEASVLTTISVVIGCLIYLQWIIKDGFYTLKGMVESNNDLYLTNRFFPHFLLVSAIVYFVMIIVTWIGVWIPARNISKISPIDALRDE